MTKINTIFLDWNNTLSASKFWQNFDQKNNIETVLFKKNPDLVQQWMLGKIKSKNVCKIISKALDIDSQTLYIELLKSCQSMTFIDKQIKELLAKLKQKYHLVIATDNMDVFSTHIYPSINKHLIFENYLNSSEIGCFKFDFFNGKLPFFEKYLCDNQLTYDRVLLIDDSIDKKGNFAKLGFKIINTQNPTQFINILKKLCPD